MYIHCKTCGKQSKYNKSHLQSHLQFITRSTVSYIFCQTEGGREKTRANELWRAVQTQNQHFLHEIPTIYIV